MRTPGGSVGHGAGSNRPSGSGCPCSTAARIVSTPRRKQLNKRGRARPVARRRATCSSGSAATLLAGSVASASPPTLTTHNVATASANHSRAARAGSVIFVWCHCHPPRFMSLNPLSIQLRIPYQAASATSGARSVAISHGSA